MTTTMTTTKVTVNVTPTRIQWGVRQSSSSCPIALALRDLGYRSVTVGKTEASVTVEDDLFFGLLPPEAREFVEAFDHGQNPEPITFDLELKLDGDLR